MGKYDKGSPTRESIEALIEKILDNREQFVKLFEPEDWMAFAHIIHLTNKAMNNKKSDAPTAKELADRLDACESHVKDGDWKYDKVPADLVRDLLDHLRAEERNNE